MEYGYTIVQTHSDGTQELTSVSGCQTLDDAMTKAFELAKATGWTPPKWWQWWRWGDTKEPKRSNAPLTGAAQEPTGNGAE